MKHYSQQRNAQRGFTLIEVMVAFAVLAFGLLTVASFQSKLISGSSLNKARSEAIALAQQKLDEIRSYTDQQTLVANLAGRPPVDNEAFPDDVADGDFPQTGGELDEEEIQGINATYLRWWNVVVAGDVADVVVTVNWTDSQQGDQSVSLATAVTWKNPRGGAILNDVSDPAVPSATGRAHLGEGEMAVSDVASGDNGDGTASGDFDGDGDLELVDLNSEDEGMVRVVLTLKDACNTETGLCTDFVRISGRVYIDKATSSMDLADVYVLASDAAYCARDLTTTDDYTDYDYYDYTCYLGGGWHGNIGLLLNSTNAEPTACVGDPNAGVDGTDAWKRVELVRRRVYRGMIHQFGDSSTGISIQDGSGNHLYYALTDEENGEGDPLLYSQGIADAAKMPDTDYWPARNGGHDFVLIGGNKPDVTDCESALTRNDAVTEGLFNNVPGDFICLNNDNDPNLYEDGVDPNDYNDYLDTFKEGVYRAPNDCPFDPSDPPAYRYLISGEINTGGTTPSEMRILTSDGTDNCRWTISGSTTDYECDIYVREDADGNLNGWDGNITVTAPASYLCAAPDSHPVNETTVYTNPVSQVYSDVLAPVSGQDYTCVTLASPHVTGTITAPGSDLRGATIEVDDPSAECTFTPPGDSPIVSAVSPVDEATFDCTLFEPSVGAGWSGTITFVPPEGMPADACNATQWSYTALSESVEAKAPDGGALECNMPQDAVLKGNLSVTAPLAADELFSTLEIRPEGCSSCACSLSQTDMTYTCDLTYYGDGGWSGDIIALPNNPDIACDPPSYTVSGVTGTAGSPTSGQTFSCEEDLSGPVTVSGTIYIYDPTKVSPVGITMTGTPANGVCEHDPLSSQRDPQSMNYTCTTPVIDATWAGEVSLSSGGGVICGSPHVIGALVPRDVYPLDWNIQKPGSKCP